MGNSLLTWLSFCLDTHTLKSHTITSIDPISCHIFVLCMRVYNVSVCLSCKFLIFFVVQTTYLDFHLLRGLTYCILALRMVSEVTRLEWNDLRPPHCCSVISWQSGTGVPVNSSALSHLSRRLVTITCPLHFFVSLKEKKIKSIKKKNLIFDEGFSMQSRVSRSQVFTKRQRVWRDSVALHHLPWPIALGFARSESAEGCAILGWLATAQVASSGLFCRQHISKWP